MSRITVSRTSSSRWVGEHHRKTIFVLGGSVDGAAIPALRARAESEAREGSTRVVLDIRAIVSCDRAGLLGLVRLRGRLEAHPDCVVDVVGARLPQFADILAREAAEGADMLRGTVRELRRPLMIDPHRVPVVAPPVPAPRTSTPTATRPADS